MPVFPRPPTTVFSADAYGLRRRRTFGATPTGAAVRPLGWSSDLAAFGRYTSSNTDDYRLWRPKAAR